MSINSHLKKRWPSLTDSDLQAGTHEQLVTRVQRRTGESREVIETEIAASGSTPARSSRSPSSPSASKAYSGPIRVDWTARSAAVKARWPALTDADLRLAEGTYEELFARIASRTGESEADIAASFGAIPGFGPTLDWDAVKASLRTKWPTLTESDLSVLGSGTQEDLLARIQNRTAEKREAVAEVVNATMAEATAAVDAAKADAETAAAAAAEAQKDSPAYPRSTSAFSGAYSARAMKDKLKYKWPSLTEDDLVESQSHDDLVAAIQKRTGENKAAVEQAIKNAR